MMDPSDRRVAELVAKLQALMDGIAEEELAQKSRIDAVLPEHRMSAKNLTHYLALRNQDIHRLQLELAAVGLSSLGRCEGHVHDTLRRLCAWLRGKREEAIAEAPPGRLGRKKAESILRANTRALLGPRPSDRHTYIMVTSPDAAEVTPAWADELLDAGVDLLRINGAHGSPEDWASIVGTFKSRAAAKGRLGRVIVDMPGPKLRTEICELNNAVLHLPRDKDRLGRTVKATSVLLVATLDESQESAQVPVPSEWLTQLAAGDRIELTDAGERDRVLVIEGGEEGGVRARCDRSLYLTAELPLVWRRGSELIAEGRIGAMPERPVVLRFDVGDKFLLNARGHSDDPTLPALAFLEGDLLGHVEPGERVILDDGKIVAVAEEVRSDGLLCRVTHAVKSPTRLRSGKGVAFPDSALEQGQLGAQDAVALSFALEHADGVGVSFVSSERDVALVGERIKKSGKPGFGMILKLETRRAIDNLPSILFKALAYRPVGLMIARGDLAVELSFERLAEMQEELLWFGEACHVPVVWATQVLDSLAHTGVPTRAEVTDAAMAMRAECVMLNKGPHIADATRMLANITRKMESHQSKKRSLYRKLAVARPCAPPLLAASPHRNG